MMGYFEIRHSPVSLIIWHSPLKHNPLKMRKVNARTEDRLMRRCSMSTFEKMKRETRTVKSRIDLDLTAIGFGECLMVTFFLWQVNDLFSVGNRTWFGLISKGHFWSKLEDTITFVRTWLNAKVNSHDQVCRPWSGLRFGDADYKIF